MKLDYSTANQWQITDSHGRSHKVFFSGGRVDRVETDTHTVTTDALPTEESPSQEPQVNVYQCPTTDDCGSGERLSWQLWTFDGLGRRIREGREILDSDPSVSIARTFGLLAARVLDQDSPHGDGGGGEKVPPVVVLRLLAVEEAQIGPRGRARSPPANGRRALV